MEFNLNFTEGLSTYHAVNTLLFGNKNKLILYREIMALFSETQKKG
jgi:hypothetical protein